LVVGEPIHFDDAINIELWKEAMIEELHAFERNQNWEYVELPYNKRPIVVK